ncbi:MAG TPA: DUF4349 domain-containing protein [Puia sp.]|nr:DUF4349 domain-containing protein [Puia sp.]
MKFIIPAALLLAVLAIACNRADLNRKEAPQTAAANNTDQAAKADSAVGPGNAGSATGAGQPQIIANPDWDRKIVKTASLNVEVKNFKDYTARLHEKVRAAGGYIAQEEQSESAYKIENAVTIKVPVDRFDETVMQLSSDSDKLVNKKVSSEDVTMQLIDTKSRLETKKQVRERYMEMLKQSHSKEDVIEMQREVDNIQEQIEGAAGRIAYLGHSAAYSTINVSFYQILDVSVKEEGQPGFLHKLSDAFRDGWNWMSGLMVGLVSVWPLLLAGLLVLMWWRKRPRRSAKSSVS